MGQVTSFTQYFREERDIYVQNISSYNISVNFDMGGGNSSSYTFIPTKDPVNLTMYIPFKAIANSTEFRQMVNRNPRVLRLMEEDEYIKYYENAARAKGLRSAEEAIAKAAEAVANRGMTLETAPEPVPLDQPAKDTNGKYLSEEEVIHPRVLNLCLQVHPSVPDNQKAPAQQLLSELELLSDQLKFDDWEYVYAHGLYKSVKNYAKQMRDRLSATVEVDDTQPQADKQVKPKPKKQSKKQSSQDSGGGVSKEGSHP